MIIRVGDEELVVSLSRRTQAGRFVKTRFVERAVFEAGLAGPGQGSAFARGRIDHLDLVVVGVGDVNAAVVKFDVEGMLQSHVVAASVHVTVVEKALADDGLDVASAGV